MQWDQVEGRWQQVRGEVKRHFGKLTDDDVSTAEGHRDKLVGRIQERYGQNKDEAERSLDDFIRSL